MDLTSLTTPCLVLDAVRLRRNAARIGRKASENGIRLRPHVKTHKCVEIARHQTVGHSGAITVSTLAEAKAFAKYGFEDILYAVPIEPGKFAEVIELRKQGIALSLITDDVAVVPLLSDVAERERVTVDVSLKVDCGYHRCGVGPDSLAAFTIPHAIWIRRICGLPGS